MKTGIYIHIPFCRSKCAYCDFYSIPGFSEGLADEYLRALCDDIKNSPEIEVDTVYIGGGTPSVFGGKRLCTLINAVKSHFLLDKNAEITVEVNPESCTGELFSELKNCGVNRISMGIQSSDDRELAQIGRIHDFETAKTAVSLCKKHLTDNISLDLMYGLPMQSLKSFQKSLADIVDLEPVHISCYALTLEEHTPLFKRKSELPDDDTVADMYFAAVDFLEKNGYFQYEISNFAKNGQISRHNSGYWEQKPYFGFGASAHGFIGNKRYFYEKSIEKYIKNREKITEDENADRASEYIMLRLRTVSGLSKSEFCSRFDRDFSQYEKRLQKYVNAGYAVCENGVYRLSPQGLFVSNTIISDII